MSRVVSSVVELPGKILNSASDLISGGSSSPAPAAAPAPAAQASSAKEGTLGATETKKPNEAPVADPAVLERTKDIETRQQSLGQRAAAAGVSRSDNDADVLGYAAPKRKSAARAILG